MPASGPSTPKLRWSLRVDRHDRPEARVVAASGRVGATTVAVLEQALEQSLAVPRPRVVVDLAGVDYLSSAGLAALDRAAAAARTVDGRLVVCGLQEAVRVSFEVSGGGGGLDLADDVPAALARL